MLVQSFSNHQFKKLEKLKLPNNVTAIESELYIIDKKSKQKKYLLKKYKKTDDDYFGNKLLTINSLIDNRNKINIEELVFPEELAIIDKRVVGYIMKYIENSSNLSILLSNKNINLKDKIEWLKQAEHIISKVQYVNNLPYPFLLGDIHEDNFILNHDNGKIMCVDLDGCKISNNTIYAMKYGTFNANFYGLPKKYPLDEDEEPIPNQNTEWYCYIMMLLNTIANGPVYKLIIRDFYDYIQYLRDAGFPNELLKCFATVYTNNDNYSPKELLEQIPNYLEKVSFESFVEKTNTNHLYTR